VLSFGANIGQLLINVLANIPYLSLVQSEDWTGSFKQ